MTEVKDQTIGLRKIIFSYATINSFEKKTALAFAVQDVSSVCDLNSFLQCYYSTPWVIYMYSTFRI